MNEQKTPAEPPRDQGDVDDLIFRDEPVKYHSER